MCGYRWQSDGLPWSTEANKLVDRYDFMPQSENHGLGPNGTSLQVKQEGEDAPSSRGFMAAVRNSGIRKGMSDIVVTYRFQAPGVIRLRSMKAGEDTEPGKNMKPSPRFGAALHTIPLGKGRSRLLFHVSEEPCCLWQWSIADNHLNLVPGTVFLIVVLPSL